MNPFATFESELSGITVINFSTDDHLIAGGSKGTIKVWNITERSVVAQKSLKNSVVYADFIDDNNKILVLLKSGDINIYDRSLATKTNSLTTASNPIAASLDPNEHYLTIYGKNEELEIFDLKANMLFGKIDASKKFKKLKFLGFD